MFRSGTDLAAEVHRSNRHPAAYAHPTWFEPLLDRRLLGPLRSSRRGEKRLSDLLLARHGLDNDRWYDFGPRRWRFVLLPPEVLLHLVDCCGLAFQHRRIAATVERSARSRLVGQIGKAAYVFALKRAPLILGQRHEEAPPWDGQTAFGRFVRQSGAAYFLAHFQAAPKAIAARLAFKFPRNLVRGATGRPPNSAGWPLFTRILKHELNPKWQNLFS
jgi:hypothetical protein